MGVPDPTRHEEYSRVTPVDTFVLRTFFILTTYNIYDSMVP